MNGVAVAPRRVLTGYVALVLVALLAPALVLIPLSFSAESAFVVPPEHYSWRWYERLLGDPAWRRAALLSLEVAVVTALLASLAGSMAAVGLNRVRGRLARYLRLAFIAPMIVPVMVLAIALYFQFAEILLLGSFWSLVLAHLVLVLPFVIVTVSARLISLDPSLESAAMACGAGPFATFRRVLFPILRPAVAAGAVLAFITSFDEVVIALFLSGPRLETLPLRMWQGITVGGLENTITAVTTVELAVAAAVYLGLEASLAVRFRLRADSKPTVAADMGQSRGALQSLKGRVGASIEFDHVTKRYAEQAAVEDVTFEIEPGEFVTLLGPSGSGKTTLLSLVSGFLTPTSGDIRIDGRPIDPVPSHKRDIGFVFQQYALFPHLDVQGNIAFPLKLRGLGREEIRKRVAAALELVQLAGFERRAITQLSGGQQQRVALARAVVFEPRVLLMDEPLGALDKNLRLDMQLEIKQLHRELQQTTIYVTHDQEEALNLSDRIAVIVGGRIQQIGTPEELYLRPVNTVVAQFFGESNIWVGTARDGFFEADSGIRFPVARAEGRTAASVRPESIEFVPPADERAFLRGTVADVTFQGSVVRLVVEVGGFLVKGTLPASQLGTVKRGGAVGVRWELEKAHTMPEDA